MFASLIEVQASRASCMPQSDVSVVGDNAKILSTDAAQELVECGLLEWTDVPDSQGRT
ncbi:hypothetical protein [Ectothiorhodospira variabilis]|uniref:hypothetical protein n=1 Tax=Ectothiorhodospira variabilis TaxID=505694 RepID=UPI001EFBE702|nr:hypothetical protein [Ectothiorhodospira variabilis]MCG5497520.1 hypothetical protein [Ectothiorhodospira variabilis]